MIKLAVMKQSKSTKEAATIASNYRLRNTHIEWTPNWVTAYFGTRLLANLFRLNTDAGRI